MYKLSLFISVISFLGLFGSCTDKEEKPEKNSFLTEITDEVKLDFVHDPAVNGNYYMPESIGSGGAFFDYDNDGDLDIYLLNGAIHDNRRKNQPPLKNQLSRSPN